jgi:hypothetical protein
VPRPSSASPAAGASCVTAVTAFPTPRRSPEHEKAADYPCATRSRRDS